MARKPDVLAVAPALPSGSVDFNAFHDAIARGATAEQAIAAGAGNKPEPKPAPEPDPEPTQSADDAA